MTWHVLLVDADGQRFTSSPLTTRDDAIRHALDLNKQGDLTIVGIESDQCEAVDLGDIGLGAAASIVD